MKHNQLGKFKMDSAVLHDDLELARHVLSHVVVVRCEHDFCSRRFEFCAISDLFEEVKQGYEAPEYDMIVHRYPDGQIKVSAKQINPSLDR